MANKKSVDLTAVRDNQLWKLLSVSFGTPKVKCSWPKLGTPQTGDPKYDGKYGKYKVNLVFDPSNPKDAAFIEKVNSVHAQAVKVVNEWADANGIDLVGFRKISWRDEEVSQGTEKVKTGKVVLSLSANAAKKNKEGAVVQTPVVVTDVKGKKLSKSVKDRIFSGSTIRAAIDASPYYAGDVAGLSLRIRFVQLIDLVEAGENFSAEDYFDEIEVEGFVAGDDDADDNLSDMEEPEVTPEDSDF